MDARRVLWLDVSAGVAGDMLLAALVDAGAPLDALQSAVDAVVPGMVRLETSRVTRAGLAAVEARAVRLVEDQPHRSWRDLRALLESAALPDGVRGRALAAFTRLAGAEARVHGVDVEDVHFHEVGAWDCVADVVGVCSAIEALDVGRVVAGELALGSGTVRSGHGLLPVPVPAVLELCHGWPVTSGGPGELATPTGAALVTTLAVGPGPLPAMTVERVGVGAGHRDRPDRPNVVRAVLGRVDTAPVDRSGDGPLEPVTVLETTIDDLDPRVWPAVVSDLLAAGALDAWLTPVLMKKGRPGHVLTALAAPDAAPRLRRLLLDRTTALGVRQYPASREVLDRAWLDVAVPGLGPVAVKIGYRAGAVVHVMPEFDAVAEVAASSGLPPREVLEAASAAARAAGLVPGAPLPGGVRPAR